MADVPPAEQLYVVRFFDGFDHEWTDVSGPLPREQAEQLCRQRNRARSGTAAGKETGEYADIDYYRVFESDTVMVHSRQGRKDLADRAPWHPHVARDN